MGRVVCTVVCLFTACEAFMKDVLDVLSNFMNPKLLSDFYHCRINATVMHERFVGFPFDTEYHLVQLNRLNTLEMK